MSAAWDKHEAWRKNTKGALQVHMGRSLLIDMVVGMGRPRTHDEYVAAMRSVYIRHGVDCPVWMCKEFVDYVIPDEYIQQPTTGRPASDSGGDSKGGGTVHVRPGAPDRGKPRANSAPYGRGRGRA